MWSPSVTACSLENNGHYSRYTLFRVNKSPIATQNQRDLLINSTRNGLEQTVDRKTSTNTLPKALWVCLRLAKELNCTDTSSYLYSCTVYLNDIGFMLRLIGTRCVLQAAS